MGFNTQCHVHAPLIFRNLTFSELNSKRSSQGCIVSVLGSDGAFVSPLCFPNCHSCFRVCLSVHDMISMCCLGNQLLDLVDWFTWLNKIVLNFCDHFQNIYYYMHYLFNLHTMSYFGTHACTLLCSITLCNYFIIILLLVNL